MAKRHQEMLSEPTIIVDVIKRLQRQDVVEEILTEEAQLAGADTEEPGHAFVIAGRQDQFANLTFVLTDKQTGVENSMEFDNDGGVQANTFTLNGSYTIAL